MTSRSGHVRSMSGAPDGLTLNMPRTIHGDGAEVKERLGILEARHGGLRTCGRIEFVP